MAAKAPDSECSRRPEAPSGSFDAEHCNDGDDHEREEARSHQIRSRSRPGGEEGEPEAAHGKDRAARRPRGAEGRLLQRLSLLDGVIPTPLWCDMPLPLDRFPPLPASGMAWKLNSGTQCALVSSPGARLCPCPGIAAIAEWKGRYSGELVGQVSASARRTRMGSHESPRVRFSLCDPSGIINLG